MKKRLSKIFSCLLMTVLAVSLAVTSVNAEEPTTYATYDKSFSYSGTVQPYTVPVSGYYKLEVWGASGGNIVIEGRVYNYYGYGGYSVGYKYLQAGQTLYICVGQEGKQGWNRDEEFGEHVTPDVDPDINQYRAYNGGGYGWAYAGGGGGATHIALGSNRGELKNYSNNRSEILIVAGGGGGGALTGGEIIPGDGSVEVFQTGGSGGGVTGGTGEWKYEFGYGPGAGGTQTGPGIPVTRVNGYDGAFGTGATSTPSDAGGGGGGWYGGNSGEEAGAGGGGSGYIGGCLSTLSYNGSTYTSNTAMSNNSGNGRAVITYLGPVYHRQKVQVCYENADGTFTNYENVIDQDYGEGETVTWTRPADSTYQKADVRYTVTGAKTTQVTVYRQKYLQTLQVRYENADGTFTEYEDVINDHYAAGATVTWSEKADDIYQGVDVSYSVTGAKTTQITVYRQQYTLTIEKGDGIDSVTGEGEYRAGQAVTIEAKVKGGYEFGGWNDSETLIGAESTVAFEMPAKDLYYTAIAEAVKHSGGENNKPGDSTGGGSEDNTGDDPEESTEDDDSEKEESVLPLPTPAPAHTRIMVPADNTAQVEGEEVQIEVEELALAPVPAPTPSVDPILRSSIIKGGSIHIPLAHIDAFDTDREHYDFSFWRMAAIIACVVGVGGIILFIYYLFFRKYKIYDSRTDELIGISFIRKDERDMFWAKISDAVCERAGSKVYLVIGENFVRSNPEKPLKVSARGKEFYRQIREKVDIEFAQK